MKKSVFALLLMFVGSLAFAQYDPDALKVLEAMSKKYKDLGSFEAYITHNFINKSGGINDKLNLKITTKGSKFRLVLDDQEIINNGTTVWTYLPSAKEVNIDNFDPSSAELNPSEIFDLYKKGYQYIYLGEKTEDGIVCSEVDLKPEKKDDRFWKIKMMISKKDNMIHSWTMYEKSNGSPNGNENKYTITKFTPGVKVDDAFFTFDPKKYPGVEVIDLR